MKKAFNAIIVVVLMLLSTVAFASSIDEIDLSAFSLEELKTLQTRLEIEMNSRQSDEANILYTGAYEVGTDIDEGAYLITCTELNEGNSSCCLDIFYSPDAYKRLNYSNGEYHYLDLGETYYVSLEEGMVLYFYRGTGTITPAKRVAEETSILYTGSYLVGRDILEGGYVVTCTAIKESNASACLDVFYNYAAYKSLNYSDGEYHYLKPGENFMVSLEEGMVLTRPPILVPVRELVEV